MHLLRHLFYWASQGSPDAVPAGIIAVDLGMNEADLHDQDIKQISICCCEYGIFDDSCWQLGFTMEDVDLVRKLDRPFNYLTSDQIVSDWQWRLIKQQPGLRVSEHNLTTTIEEMEAFIEEDADDE